MASVFEYGFNLGGNFIAVMEGMIDSTGKFSAKIEDCNSWLGRLTNTFAAWDMASNYVEKISGVFNDITEAGATAELQLMNLKTLFGGNAEAAEAMYERISEYGKVTPYDKAGLLDAQRTMMSFGMSGEAAFSTLQQIGDIAMGDSQKLQSLSLAFAQMSSTGKLTGQDLMQMINAGFNPLNEISKMTGKSVGVLKEEMSKGAISADMVSEAFRIATSEGGLFYGAIEAASETTAGRMASFRDTIEEIKVSIFNFVGDFGLWVSSISELMVPLSQVMPLLTGVFGLMSKIKGLNWAGMWGRIRGALAIMVGTMSTGKNISLGFAGNIGRATIALLQFGTIGIFNALKGLGALIISLITGGATSAKFAGIASTSFGTFARTAKVACRAVGTAIMSIPIIGWVIAGVTALAALGIYFWNTSVKFRAILKGLWAGFKAFFTGLWETSKEVFGALGDLIKSAITLNPDGIKAALNRFTGAYADFGKKVGKAFTDAYNAEMEAGKKEEEKKEGEGQGVDALPGVASPTGQTLTNLGTDAGGKSGGSIRNITISIDRLVEKFEVHSTTMREGATEVKEMIEQALLQALNDANLAVR